MTLVKPLVMRGNFNPRSPHGERRSAARQAYYAAHFNPRSPHGERHSARISVLPSTVFQPTLPARGATALRRVPPFLPAISTHAPRTGSDACHLSASVRLYLFQPTLPARGATRPPRCPRAYSRDFNPRSPHGERRALRDVPCAAVISTHAPRTGSDSASPCRKSRASRFQPTLPARGATPQALTCRRW